MLKSNLKQDSVASHLQSYTQLDFNVIFPFLCLLQFLSDIKNIFFSHLLKLSPFIGRMEEILQVQHLCSISLVNPLILILLSCRDVPPPVLRVVLVQIITNKPAKKCIIKVWSYRYYILWLRFGLANAIN